MELEREGGLKLMARLELSGLVGDVRLPPLGLLLVGASFLLLVDEGEQLVVEVLGHGLLSVLGVKVLGRWGDG